MIGCFLSKYTEKKLMAESIVSTIKVLKPIEFSLPVSEYIFDEIIIKLKIVITYKKNQSVEGPRFILEPFVLICSLASSHILT